MRIKLTDLEDAPKQIFWKQVTDLYVPLKELASTDSNTKIVFTQAAMHHPVYAYSAYLAVLSLYASTDIEKYDIRVYTTANLTALVQALFASFPKVKVIEYKPLCQIKPEWHRSDFDFNTSIKTQFWWDEELTKYDVVCGLDADLYSVGHAGSFKKLEALEEGILLCPSGDPWEIFVHMMKNLNKHPDKNVFGRLEKIGIKNVREGIKSRKWWGNSSLHAFPSKYLKDPKFKQLLELWFSEPCYCDESFLAIYSIWRDIEISEINAHLIDCEHYLEHHSLFDDKTIPMHQVDYPFSAGITHRLSTHDSARKMMPRFQEYVTAVGDNFRRKYDQR